MSLVRTGGGVTDITGSMAGNVFARDSSGLHVRSTPRRVNSPSPAQLTQRRAFAKARTYSKDNRTVSYLIYRALNNLPFIFDAFVTGDPDPDCTGKYVLADYTHDGSAVYEMTDGPWLIFHILSLDRWYIAVTLEAPKLYWWRTGTIQGVYEPHPLITGHPIVQLQVTPPPTDYNPPQL